MTNIKIYLTLLVGTLLLQFLLRWQGHPLTDATASPRGIVSLELASTPAQVDAVLGHWNDNGLKAVAKKNIWLDFLFIPFYMLLFYTLCGSISVRMKGFGAKLGVLLAFGALIAALFDVLENGLMLLSLSGTVTAATTALTAFFATSKFILLALCLLYVIPLGLRLIILKIAGSR